MMVADPAHDRLPPLGPDKVLAIGVYGETVAAYRYLVLSERAPTAEERRAFAAMADEEQDHKQRLQRLSADLFPGADFVLSAEDKALVVSGPRLIDVRGRADYESAMRMILLTERLTAAFYAQQCRQVEQPVLRDLFHELAEEGADHYQRLRKLAGDLGIATAADDAKG